MKILHSPFNVGNQTSVLSRAENKCLQKCHKNGLSVSVNFNPNFSYYPTDKTYSMFLFYQNSLIGKLINALKIFLFGLFNFRSYDIFHFYFGRTFLSFGLKTSFLNHLDLLFLKLCKKKIFMTYQGCDVRMRIVSSKNPVSACKKNECLNVWCCGKTDAIREKNISRIVKYADKIFCLNPDLLYYVPKAEFLPYAPIFLDDSKKFLRTKEKSKIKKVLHAPSDRAIKGTKYIEMAVKKLKKKYDFEFILIENMSQEKVFEKYADADIFIDQLLVGWYGCAAVEAMAFNLPVVAYINEDYLSMIPAQMATEIPIISATPNNIEQQLGKLLEDEQFCANLALKSFSFVNKWHNPDRIAECMLKLYEKPNQKFWDIWFAGFPEM